MVNKTIKNEGKSQKPKSEIVRHARKRPHRLEARAVSLGQPRTGDVVGVWLLLYSAVWIRVRGETVSVQKSTVDGL